MDNNIVVYDGELTHWGIRGMRWGIRRYQNNNVIIHFEVFLLSSNVVN